MCINTVVGRTADGVRYPGLGVQIHRLALMQRQQPGNLRSLTDPSCTHARSRNVIK